jgi:hypothetical protein
MFKRRALPNTHDGSGSSDSDSASSELVGQGRLEDISDDGADDEEEEVEVAESMGPPWKCGACPAVRPLRTLLACLPAAHPDS